MTNLDYTDIVAYADDHPDLDPEAVGLAMTAPMTKAQLRAYAVADVRDTVEGHRRHLARQAEDRAAKLVQSPGPPPPGVPAAHWPGTPGNEQANAEAEAYHAAEQEQLVARLEAERAERARHVEALGSEEGFQRLYEDPVAVIGEYAARDVPNVVGDEYRRWCGDRFDGWFQRTHAHLEVKADEETAQSRERWKSAIRCDKHDRYECAAENGSGKKCHNPVDTCRVHGPGSQYEYANLRRVVEEKFYPGGALKLITDKWHAEIVAQTRLEVTAELLATKVALGDGTMVTWGEATVEQHQQRIDMLVTGAAGTMETAARHQVAIRMIQEANVVSLDQM